MTYDAIVVGQGPSGSTAAYELASAGAKVLALDMKSLPRYKPCGGCISPKVAKVLPFAFDGVVEETVYTTVFTYKFADELSLTASEPIAYMIMRDRFDGLLSAQAAKAGAEIHDDERVTGVETAPDGVTVITDKDRYRARNLIAADGSTSTVAQRIGLTGSRKTFVTITAEMATGEAELAEAKRAAWIDLNVVPYGYGWIFPKEDHVTVGVGAFRPSKQVNKDLSGYLREFVAGHRLLAGRPYGKTVGHLIPSLSDGKLPITKDGVFLVGDAAGLVDSFIGEGIYYGIVSARHCARAILEAPARAEAEYKARVKKHLWPELVAAERIAGFVFQFPQLAFRLLKDRAMMKTFYRAVFHGEAPYKDVLNRVFATVTRYFKGKKPPRELVAAQILSERDGES